MNNATVESAGPFAFLKGMFPFRLRLVLPLAVAAALLLALLAYPAYAQSNDPPDEPTGLGASVASGVGVNLTWNDPADATITGYEVLRRHRGVDRQGVFHTIESDTGSADTAYTDATVAAGGSYVYRVKAINPHGSSVWSSYARADVPDEYEAPGSEPDPADLAPGGLTARLVHGSISLDWDAPAADAASVTGYQVSRRWPLPDVQNVSKYDLFNADGTATTYDDTAIPQAGVSYTYAVRAVRDGETSEWSNEAQVDVPEGTTLLSGTRKTPPQDPVVMRAGAIGKPTISGIPILGLDLTADTGGIEDDDGITNAVYTYQWVRVDSSDNDTDIPGATSSVYTLASADVGSRIKVTVSFTDDANNPESVTSDPVGPVAQNAFALADMGDIWLASNPIGSGSVMWLGDDKDDRIYGLTTNPLTFSLELTFDLHTDNDDPRGIAVSAGVMWVADSGEDKVFAYNVGATGTYGERLANREFDLHADNGDPTGIWTDGDALWVADSGEDKVYAYNMSASGTFGEHTGDFTLHTDNGDPWGVWSSAGVMWVVDQGETYMFAYGLANNGARMPDRTQWEFNLDDSTGTGQNDHPRGMWSNGDLIWVVDYEDDKPYAYYLPQPPDNTAATGKPTISGTPAVGQTLTADTAGINDDDGTTTSVYRYQWSRVDSSNLETDIDDATASTYTLVEDDAGSRIKVTVNFTDDDANAEGPLASDAIGPVSTKPGAPEVRLAPGSSQLRVSWTVSDGGSPITAYRVEWKESSVAGWASALSATPAASPYTIESLDNGTEYTVRVRASNANGDGDWSMERTATPEDWEVIWSGELTVGQSGNDLGFWVNTYGSLDDRDFTFEGTDYMIDRVILSIDQGSPLQFVLGLFPRAGDYESVLVLEVDGAQFPFADGGFSINAYSWGQNFPNLPSWSVNDTVALRILRIPEPQITLNFVPRSLLGSNHNVIEDVGKERVGLRAETAGDVMPSEDFDVVVRDEGQGAAQAGLDYEAFSKTYTFNAGDFQLESGVYFLEVVHELVIIDDDITERNKAVVLEIDTDALPDHVTVPAGGAAAEVKIVDNDETTISVEPPEPAEEGEVIVVTFRLDKPVGFDLIVAISILPGTAEYGLDFQSNVFEVTFNEGDTEATIRISTVEEGLEEEDETLTLRLLPNGLPLGVNLPGEPNVTLTILNDDESPVVETPSSLKTPDHSTEIITLRATDGDGDDLTWSITGGADQGLFNLTGEGALSFRSQQSYDSPGDSNRDRFYHVDVRVTDGANPVDLSLTIELVGAVSVDDVTRTTAEVTVYALPGNEGETMYLQYGTSHTWSPTQQRTVSDGTAVFRLDGLDAGGRYKVRASLDRKPLRPGDWQRDEFETEISLLYGPEWLGATPTGDGGYRLTWEPLDPDQGAGVPDITGYRIVRMDLSGRQPRVTLAGNAQGAEFTDPGPLTRGQTYYYFIHAVNSDGPSYQGARARVTPQASEGFTATPPGSPRNLRYDRDAPDGQVALRWDAPQDGTATGYVVTVAFSGDRRPGGGHREVELGRTGSTSYTHYLTRDDFPDEGYIQRSYYVRAVNDLGLRSWQAWVRVPFVGPDCDGCTDSFIRPPP